MEYTYLKDFNKTTVDNMDTVQAVISETGAMVDSTLFPLIEEAEKGDFMAMVEIYEMFAFGEHGVTQNYEMALRYCNKLHQVGLESDKKILVSTGLNNLAYLYHNFGKEEEAHDAFFEAFKYMVANLEPQEWDKQIVNLVTEYVKGLEENEEELS